MFTIHWLAQHSVILIEHSGTPDLRLAKAKAVGRAIFLKRHERVAPDRYRILDEKGRQVAAGEVPDGPPRWIH